MPPPLPEIARMPCAYVFVVCFLSGGPSFSRRQGSAGRAPPSPGGEARARRRSRGTPAMTRPGQLSRPTRTTSGGRPSPLAPLRTKRRLPPSCSGDGRDHDSGGGDQERGGGGGSSKRQWQGPRRRPLRLLRAAMPDNGVGGGGQWCRQRRHTRLFFLFLQNLFAECYKPHGKEFAVCPINGTRQRTSLPTSICRVLFAVCSTRQTICLPASRSA